MFKKTLIPLLTFPDLSSPPLLSQLSKRRNIELLVDSPFELKDDNKFPPVSVAELLSYHSSPSPCPLLPPSLPLQNTPVELLARAMYDSDPAQQLSATRTIRAKLSSGKLDQWTLIDLLIG